MLNLVFFFFLDQPVEIIPARVPPFINGYLINQNCLLDESVITIIIPCIKNIYF